MIRRVALRGVATQGIALARADMILSRELGVGKAAARARVEAFCYIGEKSFLTSVKPSSFRAVSAALARRRGERYQ
jgi:hypothetical protein